jgi:3-oxoacyl-[acyl-carrier-protein] synthase-3
VNDDSPREMDMLMHEPHPRPLRILGVGRYVPDRVVTAAELAERIGIDEAWILRNQGVAERRWITSETASQMGAIAAREALEMAGLGPTDLSLILNASGTQEQAIPDGAALIQRELDLGESGIPGFSVHATCLSFMVGLDLASHLLATGAHRHILVVSSDISSCALDFTEPEACTLFGDMAAAVVVGPAQGDEPSCIHASRLETFGIGAELTHIPGGGTGKHPNAPSTQPEDNLFHMQGRKVARLSIKHGGDFLERLQPGLSSELGDIDLVIPHQASKLGLRLMARHYGFGEDKLVSILERYGNCVAASIPGALYEAVTTGRLQRGDKALLLGTGAGLSIGGMILTY